MIKYDEKSFRPEMKEAAMKARSLIVTSSLFAVNISTAKRYKLLSTQHFVSHATMSNRTG
jgi:hypothetical protein